MKTLLYISIFSLSTLQINAQKCRNLKKQKALVNQALEKINTQDYHFEYFKKSILVHDNIKHQKWRIFANRIDFNNSSFNTDQQKLVLCALPDNLGFNKFYPAFLRRIAPSKLSSSHGRFFRK